jgi:cobalt/nickel transport system permease protein
LRLILSLQPMSDSLSQRYQPGSSPLHRLDPRVKLVVTLILVLGITLTPAQAWPAYPLLWALVASIAALGGIGAGRLARLGSVALPFALAAATLLFTTPGDPAAHVLGLTITHEGIARFAAVVLKSWLAVQAALLLSLTTHPTDLLWALSSLRVPTVLVQILSFMIRYLDTLRDEVDRLNRARASRSASVPGHKSGGNVVWRATVAGHMAGSLFLRSLERSERVYAAMQARGYRGEMRVLAAPPLTPRAVLWGAVPVIALGLIEALAALWWHR